MNVAEREPLKSARLTQQIVAVQGVSPSRTRKQLGVSYHRCWLTRPGRGDTIAISTQQCEGGPKVTAKKMTEEQRHFLYERGPISELELVEWEIEGLNPAERLSWEKRRLFLRTFAVSGIVLAGCRAAGVSRGALDKWRAGSEWFEELYQIAIEEAADRIEAEAIRRAVDGYDEPVIYQGMPTTVVDPLTGEQKQLTVRKYSDALMALVLKGARPDKYRDNHKVEVSGSGGGVLIVPGVIDPKAWAEAAREQQAKFAGNEGESTS